MGGGGGRRGGCRSEAHYCSINKKRMERVVRKKKKIQISCLYFHSLMKMFMRTWQDFVKMRDKVFIVFSPPFPKIT